MNAHEVAITVPFVVGSLAILAAVALHEWRPKLARMAFAVTVVCGLVLLGIVAVNG